MNPVTHLLASWAVAEAVPETTRRERLLITLGGVIPDLDGLGAVPDKLTGWFRPQDPTNYFREYHHDLHTALFAAICVAAAAAVVGRGVRAGRRALVALLVGVTFHLHILCDVAGSRGPDGFQWPIPYLFPFDTSLQLTWSGQWRLDGWQNVAITAGLLVLTFVLATRRGYSPLGLLSERVDRGFVDTLRARFAPHLLQPAEAAAVGEPDPPA